MNRNKLNEMVIKIKSDKKLMLIILAAAIGIILIVISSLSESVIETDSTAENMKGFNEYEYADKLEKKLESMISLIKGAGESHVIVTLECDYETVYARDGRISKDDKSTDEDNEYIIIDTQDSENGLALKTVTPKIRGVAVVCYGGDNSYVITAVTEMVSAVLDIGTNHISVAKLNK